MTGTRSHQPPTVAGDDDFAAHHDTLPHAYGRPGQTGLIKVEPDDFIVDEVLGFPLSGGGEHAYLRIEKIGENTEYIARQLARFAGIPLSNVGYAGLKDRHGRTRQWFSLGLAGKPEPDWTALDSPTLRIVETGRHHRKLKRGDLAGNHFRITVRSVTGPREALEERLRRIARGGVPNYFGPQRFGRAGGNLVAAQALLLGTLDVRSRHHRGLYLSAARSYLFNRILARRVACDLWHRPVPGDALMAGPDDRPTRRWPPPDELGRRIAALTLHPAGTLWGSGSPLIGEDALALERQALQACAPLCRGLEEIGMARAMRPLRTAVGTLDWQFPAAFTLELRFTLPSGSYATSVLRELFAAVDASE